MSQFIVKINEYTLNEKIDVTEQIDAYGKEYKSENILFSPELSKIENGKFYAVFLINPPTVKDKFKSIYDQLKR